MAVVHFELVVGLLRKGQQCVMWQKPHAKLHDKIQSQECLMCKLCVLCVCTVFSGNSTSVCNTVGEGDSSVTGSTSRSSRSERTISRERFVEILCGFGIMVSAEEVQVLMERFASSHDPTQVLRCLSVFLVARRL